MHKLLQKLIPNSFLWRLTTLNIIVIAGAILLSGWAIYETACFLVEGIETFSVTGQQHFNATLFQYVLLFAIIAVLISSITHFYFTKKLIDPVKKLIESTKSLKQGSYPEPLPVISKDEIGQLTSHYNELTRKLQENEQYRKKLVADISHELRTPIANLTGYLHAIKSGEIEANEQLFESLHGQAVQLTTLMEQMDHLNEWDAIYIEKNKMKERTQMKAIIEECVHVFTWKMKEDRGSKKYELNNLENKRILISNSIRSISKSIEIEPDQSEQKVINLYKQAKIEVPEMIVKKIEEVVSFQEKLLRNRNQRLTRELISNREKLKEVENEIEKKVKNLISF